MIPQSAFEIHNEIVCNIIVHVDVLCPFIHKNSYIFSRFEPDEPENESKILLNWYPISRFNFINLWFPVVLYGVFNHRFNQ